MKKILHPKYCIIKKIEKSCFAVYLSNIQLAGAYQIKLLGNFETKKKAKKYIKEIGGVRI